MVVKSLKVNNFITLFNARTKQGELSQEQLITIIVDLIKPKRYISYDNKISLATATIEATAKCTPCAPNRKRQFLINVINAYTDLDVDLLGFDLLSQNMFLEPIISTFEYEYKICSEILQMCLEEGDDHV